MGYFGRRFAPTSGFGRKGVAAAQPAVMPARDDDNVDDAMTVLSQALGVNLAFDIGYVMAPALALDAQICALMEEVGFDCEMQGNKVAVLTDPAAVAALAAMPADHPLRQALLKSRFALARFDPLASNNMNEDLAGFQRQRLHEFIRTVNTAEGRKYAFWDLVKFSTEMVLGQLDQKMV